MAQQDPADLMTWLTTLTALLHYHAAAILFNWFGTSKWAKTALMTT